MASTIKDVAKLCGVSVATISNVITRKKNVSPEVTQRVLQAMRWLDYRPNMIARSLKVKKTNYIGVLAPDISNPFFAEIVKGVESVAREKGCQFFLCNTGGDLRCEEDAIDSFVGQNVDGIINIAPRMADDALLGCVSMPHVVVDRPIETPGRMGCVCSNNLTGCRELARHFLDMGHSRFACFAGPLATVPNARTRLAGFREELLRAGVCKRDIVVYAGEFTFEDGYAFMEKLLARKVVPTAVFVSSDLMAWGALECAKERGLHIPQDMAIAGFDNVYLSTLVSPALSTVDAPKFAAGAIGFRILHDMMSGKLDGERRVMMETSLVVRGSTSFLRRPVKRFTAGKKPSSAPLRTTT
ncbi:MAG: LacI family transcriptional regulator [Planctomycetaceae bacterium]|nr:LacI family transcriptional regulator [Planctomycetaceae bacterium]